MGNDDAIVFKQPKEPKLTIEEQLKDCSFKTGLPYGEVDAVQLGHAIRIVERAKSEAWQEYRLELARMLLGEDILRDKKGMNDIQITGTQFKRKEHEIVLRFKGDLGEFGIGSYDLGVLLIATNLGLTEEDED